MLCFGGQHNYDHQNYYASLDDGRVWRQILQCNKGARHVAIHWPWAEHLHEARDLHQVAWSGPVK